MKFLIIPLVIACSVNLGWSQEKATYASSTIALPVSDLEKATQWYQQLLGEVESFSPAPGVIEFQLNEMTWLQLFEGELGNTSILRLEASDIKLVHEKITSMGISPTPIDVVPNVVSYFDFADPDGNQLSFYELGN